MENIVAFFKSKLGKAIIILVVLIIIYLVVAKQIEKKKYGGMTKSDLEKQLARDLANEKLTSIQNSDPNWQNANTEEKKIGILTWYDENGDPNQLLTDAWLKSALSKYGVDYVKYPETLNMKDAIISHYSLVSTFKGY